MPLVRTPRPNAYDYIKIIALISMIIDHLGFFFFPDEVMWRVLGRIAFPVFLFLVGYNGSFGTNRSLIVMAVVVQVVVGIGYYLDYTNLSTLTILGVIVLVRLFLSYTKGYPWLLLLGWVGGMVFMQDLRPFMDYGTLGLSFAILGYWASGEPHRYFSSISRYFSWAPRVVGYGVGLITIGRYGWMMLVPGFFLGVSWFWVGFVGIVLCGMMGLLYHHNPSMRFSPYRDRVVQWISSQSLMIYVIHLLFFVVISGLLH